MKSFKDESFILQCLSPRVIREHKLFAVLDDDREAEIHIAAIHDDPGYREIRRLLSAQYDLGEREPDLQVVRVDVKGDRSLTMAHRQHRRRPLGTSTKDVMRHLHRLWGFPVHIDVVPSTASTKGRVSFPSAT